jgi:hypothetical protein
VDVGALAYSARTSVAVVLLLSAGWKLTHQGAFQAAFRASAPPQLRSLARLSTFAVPAIEILCASLLFVPSSLGRAGSLLAVLLLLGFTVSLALSRDLTAGCGCWREPGFDLSESSRRRVLLRRNGLLLALALAGVMGPNVEPDLLHVVFGLAVGGLVGLILLELPEIGAIVALSNSQKRESLQRE